MNCPKCGAILEEDAKFCASCGTRLDDLGETSSDGVTQDKQNNHSTTFTPQKAETKKERKANVLGLIVGTLIIVIGLIRVVSAGTSISATSFGGDFYTYTYQGIVAISEILASIEQAIGWLIVAVGAGIDVISMKH